jgi:hypothetical protein
MTFNWSRPSNGFLMVLLPSANELMIKALSVWAFDGGAPVEITVLRILFTTLIKPL